MFSPLHPCLASGMLFGHGRRAFVRLSFVFPFYFPGRGRGWWWYCSLLSPYLPVSFPASLAFPFSFCPLVGSVRFCARLSGFPSLFVFPSLLVSLSFLISFFPRAGGGWSLFRSCCVVVLHTFLLPMSFPLSTFPGSGGNVLFCPSLYFSGVCRFLLSLLTLRPSFLSPLRGGWSRLESLALDKQENSRHSRQASQ